MQHVNQEITIFRAIYFPDMMTVYIKTIIRGSLLGVTQCCQPQLS